MHLIVVYLVLVVAGEICAFFIGRIFEQMLPQFSMLIFMAMFFGVMWLAWPLAVMLADRLLPEHPQRT